MLIAALINLGGASLATGVMQQDAWAQTAQQTAFNIPAGPLAGALAEFGRQSGRQVTYDPGVAAGKRSPGISGTVAPEAALARLLEGSGLSYRPIGAGTFTIEADIADAYAPGVGDDSLLLDTITVTSEGGVSPADEPYRGAGSRAYISGEQVERFRGTSVGDFLSGVPGVLNGDARNSGALDVNIRGMQGQGRVPVVIDGATQETTTYQGYNGSTARSYIDPDFIGSVAIEKGPSAGADATGASGGVVRVSTIGAKDILLPGHSFGVRLKGGFNTNSSSPPAAGTSGGYVPQSFVGRQYGLDRPPFLKPTGGSGSIAVAGVTEHLEVVVAYAQRKNGNYYAGKKGGDGARPVNARNQYGNPTIKNDGLTLYRSGEEVLNTSIDNESWLLKTKLKLNDGHALELAYSRYLSDYGQVLGRASMDSTLQGLLSSIDLDTWTARYRWKPKDSDLINLKVDSFFTEVDNRINSAAESYYQDPVGNNVTRFWVGSERRGVTASNTSRFYTEVGDFSLEYGGAFTRENVGLPDGVDRDWYRSFWGLQREGWRKESSGFTSLEWKPLSWLTLNGSARYSHFESQDDYQGNSESFKRSDNGWSPIASITVEPLDGLQVYGKYGSVLRSPSIFESLTSLSFYFPATENPVKPERNNSLEFGVNYLKDNVFINDDKLRLHAAYFSNHIDDYITRSHIYRGLTSKGRPNYNLGRLNLDYAEMRGFEVSAQYDTGRYYGSLAWNHYTHVMFCAPQGKIHPNYATCSASGLYNSFSLQQVPPKDTVTLDLGARLLEQDLTVGARLNYIGSRYAKNDTQGTEGVTQGSSGVGFVRASRWNPYALVDLYASYKLNPNVQLDLTVDNLTDRYYVDAIGAALLPAPGRTVRGSVTVKF
ncbi:TonB-dependent receptor [Brenneria tiliae]|uniref:TonB-dependent receptor n=1 Tax=Brenneria tiliae TaxID=2914984 RepID=UPI002014A103|nr:TonB-dependent receptor [Brenneria tiliae]MCL2898743.1 TonB-dependent receptor [Brenneria tiliae]MCL2903320.1 TonB-dependent receptor [Brenneria tiliae]